MKLTDIPAGQLNAAVLALSKALGDGGEDIALSLRTDLEFTERVARHMLAGAPEQVIRKEGLITIEIAAAILGEDKVFGPDQIRQASGEPIDNEAVAAANIIPYKLETLVRCKGDYILVYGAPTTIGNIAVWSRMQFGWIMPTQDVKNPPFKTDVPMSGWFLIKRSPQERVSEPRERYATLVEIYLALSLHKRVSPRHFFFQQHAVCHQTAQGGEIYFGLGSAFGRRSDDGGYDYWAVKSPHVKDPKRFAVVLLPDNPPIK